MLYVMYLQVFSESEECSQMDTLGWRKDVIPTQQVVQHTTKVNECQQHTAVYLNARFTSICAVTAQCLAVAAALVEHLA
jgi:hypothetical protein